MTSPPPDQWGPPPAPWGPQRPQGPARRGNGLKWLLGAVVLVVVVAVSVGATLFFTRGDANDDGPKTAPTTSDAASDIASANDKGPVGIITGDPSCALWTPINDALANRQGNGWRNRDASAPAVVWSPEVREIFTDVGDAFDEAADQTVLLLKVTQHRVMRELYEQFIAYARAYADSLATYAAADNHLANVAVSATYVLINMCNAAEHGSAAARGPLVSLTDTPARLASPGISSKPPRFLKSADSVCAEWATTIAQVSGALDDFARTDPNVPVNQWSNDQRALMNAVAPALRQNADEMQSLGKRSENPVLQDFAILAVAYQRAFIAALPTYAPNDQYLYNAAAQAETVINEACLAVES